MAYDFYMDSMLLPVAPSKLTITIDNKNKTMVLINDGEINVLKKAGLTDISFTALLPQVKYPFAVYKGKFEKADAFLDKLEQLKVSQKPFQFIVSRTFPSGKLLFDTNIKVSLESYKILEDVKNGFDVNVEVKLKQYKDYGTKTVNVTIKQEPPVATVQKPSSSSAAPSTTIKIGDMVKINQGAKYYTGQSVPDWVMKGVYKVYYIGNQPDRIVVDKTGINSPFRAADLTVVTSSVATVQNTRPTETSPAPKVTAKTHTVVSGDTLWGIAKKYYGNGALYNKLYDANKGVIKNPNLIYVGQVFTIPV